jgi:hypothetical protein
MAESSRKFGPVKAGNKLQAADIVNYENGIDGLGMMFFLSNNFYSGTQS